MGDNAKKAVERMVREYPATRLQDLYKSFYQDRFGPGHMIADTVWVFNYLQQELEEEDRPHVLYEPTGAHGRFYRVYLKCVQDGLITAQELCDAFVRSASVPKPEKKPWKEEWGKVLKAIEKSGIKLEDYEADKARIDEMLRTQGDEAVHHSAAYNEAYEPHYRIVARDIFEKEILPKLPH